MARNVEPQMSQMHANASRIRRRSRRETRSGTELLLERRGFQGQCPVLLQRLERDGALGRTHGLDGAEALAQEPAEGLRILDAHLDEVAVLPRDVVHLEHL